MELVGGLIAAVGLVACFFIWLLPILLIGMSSRTRGGEKVAWILAVIFVSWFAWIFYMLLAPLKAPERYRYRY